MAYQLTFKRKAIKALQRISEPYYSNIMVAIDNLRDNPRPHGYKKLRGINAYRIRVGSYRVVYNVIDDKLVITILSIGHRKDVYED